MVQKSHLNDQQKLVYILSDENSIWTTAKYIFLALEHRKTTLDVLNFVQNLTDELVSQVGVIKLKHTQFLMSATME